MKNKHEFINEKNTKSKILNFLVKFPLKFRIFLKKILPFFSNKNNFFFENFLNVFEEIQKNWKEKIEEDSLNLGIICDEIQNEEKYYQNYLRILFLNEENYNNTKSFSKLFANKISKENLQFCLSIIKKNKDKIPKKCIISFIKDKINQFLKENIINPEEIKKFILCN